MIECFNLRLLCYVVELRHATVRPVPQPAGAQGGHAEGLPVPHRQLRPPSLLGQPALPKE